MEMMNAIGDSGSYFYHSEDSKSENLILGMSDTGKKGFSQKTSITANANKRYSQSFVKKYNHSSSKTGTSKKKSTNTSKLLSLASVACGKGISIKNSTNKTNENKENDTLKCSNENLTDSLSIACEVASENCISFGSLTTAETSSSCQVLDNGDNSLITPNSGFCDEQLVIVNPIEINNSMVNSPDCVFVAGQNALVSNSPVTPCNSPGTVAPHTVSAVQVVGNKHTDSTANSKATSKKRSSDATSTMIPVESGNTISNVHSFKTAVPGTVLPKAASSTVVAHRANLQAHAHYSTPSKVAIIVSSIVKQPVYTSATRRTSNAGTAVTQPVWSTAPAVKTYSKHQNKSACATLPCQTSSLKNANRVVTSTALKPEGETTSTTTDSSSSSKTISNQIMPSVTTSVSAPKISGYAKKQATKEIAGKEHILDDKLAVDTAVFDIMNHVPIGLATAPSRHNNIQPGSVLSESSGEVYMLEPIENDAGDANESNSLWKPKSGIAKLKVHPFFLILILSIRKKR